jgi:hypothetical protein
MQSRLLTEHVCQCQQFVILQDALLFQRCKNLTSSACVQQTFGQFLCHVTWLSTHTIYIYTYSQILTSNGIPHIHVFSQVDMLLTRWKENPLQPTEHCVASTVGPHSIPMDSDFLWLQASQRIGTNACQFPVSNAGHRFSEIRTKNGKLILLQNKLVRCQFSIGCIIPILCNLWYRLNFSKFFCKARFRFYIWGKTLKPMV